MYKTGSWPLTPRLSGLLAHKLTNLQLLGSPAYKTCLQYIDITGARPWGITRKPKRILLCENAYGRKLQGHQPRARHERHIVLHLFSRGTLWSFNLPHIVNRFIKTSIRMILVESLNI
jgi:hypothetical protein